MSVGEPLDEDMRAIMREHLRAAGWSQVGYAWTRPQLRGTWTTEDAWNIQGLIMALASPYAVQENPPGWNEAFEKPKP